MTAKTLMERVEELELWWEPKDQLKDDVLAELLAFAEEVRAMDGNDVYPPDIFPPLPAEMIPADELNAVCEKHGFPLDRLSAEVMRRARKTASEDVLAMLGAEKGGRPCEARSPVQGVAHEVSAEQAEDVSDRPAEPDSRPSESPKRGGKGANG